MKKFWGLTPWMLEATIALEWSLGKYFEMYVIMGLLVFNAVLGFIQEERANSALELPKEKLRINARVKRDGKWGIVPASELVPGDLIRLRTGDFVPADVKVAEGTVEVDQSALTGESQIVGEKVDEVLYGGAIIRRGNYGNDWLLWLFRSLCFRRDGPDGPAGTRCGPESWLSPGKEICFMTTSKIFLSVALSLGLAIAFFGCAKEQKGEAPKQEQVTKDLVPAKVEMKGQNFSLDLSDLKVAMTLDAASKEITETPSLKGNVKITNTSKDILDIQAVTLEYLDDGGNPISFKSGEKIAKASLFLKAIKPGEFTEGSLDVTIPRAAVKEKALGKIEVNLVYVPSPLKREVLTLPEKLG